MMLICMISLTTMVNGHIRDHIWAHMGDRPFCHLLRSETNKQKRMRRFTINDKTSRGGIFAQFVVSDARVFAFVFWINSLDRQSRHAVLQLRREILAQPQQLNCNNSTINNVQINQVRSGQVRSGQVSLG